MAHYAHSYQEEWDHTRP